MENGLEIPRVEAGGPVRRLVQEEGKSGQDQSGSYAHEDGGTPENMLVVEPWDSQIVKMWRVRERRSKDYS